MRVVILADELFASRERSLLTRLEVGLADEGVRVIHAVPDTVPEHTPGGAADLSGVFSRVVMYPQNTLPLMRGHTVRQIERSLGPMLAGQDESVDVVHVYGGGGWQLGADLAAQLGADLVLEVWRSGLAERAKGLKLASGQSAMFLTADPVLEREFRNPEIGRSDGASGYSVRSVPWGVLCPPKTRTVMLPGRPVSVMIVGNGREGPAWGAVFDALGSLAASADLLLFCDARAARRSDVWAQARRLGLLDRLSLIEELEGRRDLILQGDLLLLPEAHGEQRSVVLEAMAAGMVVAAAADASSGLLKDGQTSRLAKVGDAASWRSVLSEVLAGGEAISTLTDSAHRYVQTHRRASEHVRGVLAAYEWLGSGDSIRFPGPGRTSQGSDSVAGS